jgi:hypothetical protein
MHEEVEALKIEKDSLQQRIAHYQASLPVDGIPVVPAARRSREASYALFQAYIADRTRRNWHFYPYSLVLRRIFDAFQSTVTCDSTEEFIRSLHEWKTNALSLVHLRQAASQAVMDMGRTTSLITGQLIETSVPHMHCRLLTILAPEQVPEECVRLATSEFQ